MEGLFIWDATQGVPNTQEERWLIRETIPNHDTTTANYKAFIKAIHAFEADIEKYYPNIYYQGFYVFDNGVSFEPLPYEIVPAFNNLIIETALNNGLNVYDGLLDELYTVETAKQDYQKGKVVKAWRQQLNEVEERLKRLDNEDYVYPENTREAKKLKNKLVKQRLKQEGITDVKKDSNGFYLVDFGDIQLKFYINVFPLLSSMDANVRIYLNIDRYFMDNKMDLLYIPAIEFIDAYNIADKDLEDDKSYVLEGAREHPEILYYELNRAIDLFITIYKQCQSLEGLYQFYLNKDNDLRFQPRTIDSRDYNPFLKSDLVVLAKLTKQPDYEALKEEYRRTAIDESIKRHYRRIKEHEDSEEARRQHYKSQGKDYEKQPYQDKSIVKGANNPEEVLEKNISEFIDTIDALDVDALLSMDLPKGRNVY